MFNYTTETATPQLTSGDDDYDNAPIASYAPREREREIY